MCGAEPTGGLAAGLGHATRVVGAEADGGVETLSVRGHAANRARFGNTLVPLPYVGSGMMAGGTPTAGEPVRPESATSVETSLTAAGLPLAEIASNNSAHCPGMGRRLLPACYDAFGRRDDGQEYDPW